MAKFIHPALTTCHLDYIGNHINHPINIDLCTSIIKENEPNGYGKEYPIIKFKGMDIKWYYGEHGHDIRDKQYHEILDTFK